MTTTDLPGKPAAVQSGRFAALASRNYRLYVSGQSLSAIGTWIQITAQGWLVFQLTGSPFFLGLTSSLNWLPSLFVAPIGGMIADRFGHRRVLIVTQSAAMALAFVLGFLTAAELVRIEHVLAISLLLGLAQIADFPARQALIPDLVEESALLNAVAFDSMSLAVSRSIGPAVAGVLVANVGITWCFYINGLTFLPVIGALVAIRLQPPRPGAHTTGRPGGMTEGFRYLGRQPALAAALALVVVGTVFVMPAATLMPIFAGEILAVGPAGFGVLLGAMGAGSIAGALAMAVAKSLPGRGKLILAGFGGFVVTTLGFALSREYSLSILLLLASGFAHVGQLSTTRALFQSGTPRELRGRVMAVYQMAFRGMAPVGDLQAGAVATLIGAPATLAVGAALAGLTTILVALVVPSLRRTS